MQTRHTITTALAVTLGISLPAFAQQACVRVAHLSPDAPTMDVRFDGIEVFDSAGFPYYSPYINLIPGNYVLQLTEEDNPGAVLLEMAIRVAANRSYTIAAVGRASELDVVILDDLTTPMPPGHGASRLFHVSPDAPLVDIVGPDGTVYVEDLSSRTATEYTLIPVGDYVLQPRTQDGEILLTKAFTVTEGEVVTGSGAGFDDGVPPLQEVIVTDFPNDCSLDFQQPNYSGMWYDPSRNGQGVQLVNNGAALEGAWYVYDSEGMATFYTFTGTLDGRSLSTELLAWTGPEFGEDWDDAQLDSTPVGTVSIQFEATLRQATMTWVEDSGASGTLTLEPYFLGLSLPPR